MSYPIGATLKSYQLFAADSEGYDLAEPHCSFPASALSNARDCADKLALSGNRILILAVYSREIREGREVGSYPARCAEYRNVEYRFVEEVVSK